MRVPGQVLLSPLIPGGLGATHGRPMQLYPVAIVIGFNEAPVLSPLVLDGGTTAQHSGVKHGPPEGVHFLLPVHPRRRDVF